MVPSSDLNMFATMAIIAQMIVSPSLLGSNLTLVQANEFQSMPSILICSKVQNQHIQLLTHMPTEIVRDWTGVGFSLYPVLSVDSALGF